MASKSLGTLTIDLIAKTGLFQEGLDKGGRAAQKFARDVGKQADQVEAAFDTAFKAVGIAAGVAFGAVSLAVKNSIEEMGQLVTYAKQVAMPIDDFSAFAQVAKNAEVSTDSFTTSLRALDKSLAQAKQGSAQYAAAFKALGIDPSKINTTKQALFAIADAFSKYRDDSNKVAIAQQLLSRSGTEMIDFLDQGSAAIQKAADHQRDLGNALDENGAKKWQAYDDAVDEFHNTIDGLTKTLAVDLLPTITDVTKEATGFIQSWNNNGGLKQATAAIRTLLDNLDAIAAFFATRFVVTKAIAGIVAIGNAATVAGTAIGTMRVALAALGGPIGLVATAIAGGITALIEYNKHFDEMRKAIDQSNASLRTFLGLTGAAQFKQSGVLAASVQRDTETLKTLSAQIDDVTKQRNAAIKDAAGRSWSAAGEASRGQLAALDGQLAKLKAQQKELTATRDKNQATLDQYRKDLADPHSALHAGQTGTGPLPSIKITDPNAAKATEDPLASLTAFNSGLQAAEVASLSAPLKQYVDTMTRLSTAYDDAIKKGGNAASAQALFDEKAAEANQTLGMQENLLESNAMADFLKQNKAAIEGITGAEETFRETSAMATKALDAGAISWDAYQRVVQRAADSLNGISDHVKKADDAMSQFSIQAARNMQSAFADFLFDPFKDGLKGMLGSFIDTLRRMAAEAIAAKVFNSIGDWGKQNQGDGGWAGALASFASAFGGGRAGGGPVAAGGLYQVNENGPELLAVGGRQYLMMGPQSGTVEPASRSRAPGGTTINVAVQPTSTRRTADQVATMIARQQRIATARNG
jgi:hypothetical protein